MTLAELIAQRRAAIADFEQNLYGHAEHDISSLNEAIERAPIASTADALAAIDLVISETSQVGPPLAMSILNTLRRFIADEGYSRELGADGQQPNNEPNLQEGERRETRNHWPES